MYTTEKPRFYVFLRDFVLLLHNFRLTLLILPMLFINARLFVKLVVISISLDICLSFFIIPMLVSNYFYRMLIKDGDLTNPNTTSFSHPIIDQLRKYTVRRNGEGLLKHKQIFVYKTPSRNLVGAISYSFMFGPSFIVLPELFNLDYNRNKTILAHEYTHASFHDHNRCFCYNYRMVSMIYLVFLSMEVVFMGLSLYSIIGVIFLIIMFYYSFGGGFDSDIELDANVRAIGFIEESENEESARMATVEILSLLNSSAVATKPKSYHSFCIYSQIRILSNYLNPRDKEAFLYKFRNEYERLSKRIDTLFDKFFSKSISFQEYRKKVKTLRRRRVNLNNLIRLYNAIKTSNDKTSNQIIQMPFSTMYLISYAITTLLCLLVCYNYLSSTVISLSWGTAVMVLIIVFVALILNRLYSLNNYKNRWKIVESIGSR